MTIKDLIELDSINLVKNENEIILQPVQNNLTLRYLLKNHRKFIIEDNKLIILTTMSSNTVISEDTSIVNDYGAINESWNWNSTLHSEDGLQLPDEMKFNSSHVITISCYACLMVLSAIGNISVLRSLIK